MIKHTWPSVVFFSIQVSHQDFFVSLCEPTIWCAALAQIHTVDEGSKRNSFSMRNTTTACVLHWLFPDLCLNKQQPPLHWTIKQQLSKQQACWQIGGAQAGVINSLKTCQSNYNKLAPSACPPAKLRCCCPPLVCPPLSPGHMAKGGRETQPSFFDFFYMSKSIPEKQRQTSMWNTAVPESGGLQQRNSSCMRDNVGLSLPKKLHH